MKLLRFKQNAHQNRLRMLITRCNFRIGMNGIDWSYYQTNELSNTSKCRFRTAPRKWPNEWIRMTGAFVRYKSQFNSECHCRTRQHEVDGSYLFLVVGTDFQRHRMQEGRSTGCRMRPNGTHSRRQSSNESISFPNLIESGSVRSVIHSISFVHSYPTIWVQDLEKRQVHLTLEAKPSNSQATFKGKFIDCNLLADRLTTPCFRFSGDGLRCRIEWYHRTDRHVRNNRGRQFTWLLRQEECK